MINSAENSAIRAIQESFGSLRVFDVSSDLGPDIAHFFPNPTPRSRSFSDHATHGVASYVWEIHEHSGSHVDAPFHFDPDGLTMDQVPVESLLLRSFKKFDLKHLDPQPGEPVDAPQLIEAAERGGFELGRGDVALLDFGWDQYQDGAGTRGREWWGKNEPGLTDDACSYLAAAEPCAVASDTAACDFAVKDGEMSFGTGHTKHFLPNGILIIEGLRHLAEVPPTGLFLGLPLKLVGGTGSPIRVALLAD